MKKFWRKIVYWFGLMRKKYAIKAIEITNQIKEGLHSQILDYIIDKIPGETDDRIVAVSRRIIHNVLAVELSLSKLPDFASKEDIEAFAAKVLAAFGVLQDNEKAKLYTTLAAQIYVALEDGKITFGEGAAVVEIIFNAKYNS